MPRFTLLLGLALAAIQLTSLSSLLAESRPNIVLIIADDQGYGDLGHTGNPVIKTPNIDALAAESSQLSDYHVAPTCSPSRSALLTGHWTDRTGVWHTINGRSMLRANEVTIGKLLSDSGYETGMFGKWHLGDNYPYRPEDRGFTEVYRHGGGGVGQTPDVWDNAYFDGSYFHNGEIVPAKGFCTDVFFDQASKFIRKNAEEEKPFFAYISTNAPHGPLHCPQKYMDMYQDQSKGIAAFFGMITNIDDNVGKTRALLKDLGIEENTIFIYTTDNGTATGRNVFNAGMRGGKGSEYDGGHRVPFILHWPAGNLDQNYVNDTITHAVDIVPTLLDYAGATKPESITFDGRSVRQLLDPKKSDEPWSDRFLVTDSQRVRDPIKWRKTAVMSDEWRLINGKELYAIKKDPGQEKNVIREYPEQAEKMRKFYDAWWAELEPTFAQTTEIYLGQPGHSLVQLTAHDWIADGTPPWNQASIRKAQGAVSKGNSKKPRTHEGHWAVKVIRDGTYEIELLRWPTEAKHPITASLPAGENVPGASVAFRANEGIAIDATSAKLRINGETLAEQEVKATDRSVSFKTDLTAGSHKISPIFDLGNGNEVGAYYVNVRYIESN